MIEPHIHKGLEVITCKTQADWAEWLKGNWRQEEAVWLKFAKKGTDAQTVSPEQARDSALCYGWIDGLINGLDETYYLLRFTKRRPKSTWSKINCEAATHLVQLGEMLPPGQAEIDAARKDGRWDAAYSPSEPIISAEFKTALSKNPLAKHFFEGLSKSHQFQYTYWINEAKRPETSSRRIAQAITMLNKNQKRM